MYQADAALSWFPTSVSWGSEGVFGRTPPTVATVLCSGFSFLARSHVSPSNYCVLQSYWPLVKVRRWIHSQSVFCTFSLFFWIFWCTTFNVVRKFPRNKTRNVSASIKTWNKHADTLIMCEWIPVDVTVPVQNGADTEHTRDATVPFGPPCTGQSTLMNHGTTVTQVILHWPSIYFIGHWVCVPLQVSHYLWTYMQAQHGEALPLCKRQWTE